MHWQPKTTHKIRLLRAQLLHEVRNYFYQQHVLEVETPALSQSGNTDPFIESFQFDQAQSSNINNKRYLHTSPEYPMKRLLTDNSGDIYQICKVWREGEFGKNHNPEFTLLEWYRLGFSYQQLIKEVSQLLHNVLPSLKKADQVFTYEILFLEKFGFNPHIASRQELIVCAQQNIENLYLDNLDQQALLDALLTHCIEPNFNNDCLTFITDYPATQSALAQIREGHSTGGENYAVAERFEVYLGPTELGNGYQEETDYQRNKDILNSENIAREKNRQEKVNVDKYFLEATKHNIPYCAGVAIGIDRVLMCLCKEDSIQKVINFPWDVA